MLYRFVSIETFLDIILNQHLVFVHPSLWDDPYEEVLINNIWKNIDNENYVLLMLTYILSHNFYAQSWTSLDESDALWRIYSHNNTSINQSNMLKILKILIFFTMMSIFMKNSQKNV